MNTTSPHKRAFYCFGVDRYKIISILKKPAGKLDH